ncbi:HEAT repeat domain-containing protein, partial [Candidatus Woesearchaeota archaeon]|nr:HEAT repeat domain-containing protein [Candidatus Woesearchaeota archaeon]
AVQSHPHPKERIVNIESYLEDPARVVTKWKEEVRLSISNALNIINSYQIIKPLIKQLQEAQDNEVKVSILKDIVKTITTKLDDTNIHMVVEPLILQLKKERNNYNVQERIENALVQIKSDKAVEILGVYLSQEQDSYHRSSLIRVLATINSDKSLELLGNQLSREKEKYVKIEIINELMKRKSKKGIEILEAQLQKETDNEIKIAIVNALYDLIVKLSRWESNSIISEKTADVLRKRLLEEQDKEVKIKIIEVLGNTLIYYTLLKKEKTIEALGKKLLEEQDKEIVLKIINIFDSHSIKNEEGVVEIFGKKLLVEKDIEIKSMIISILYHIISSNSPTNGDKATKALRATEVLGLQLSQEQNKGVKLEIIQLFSNIRGDKAGEILEAQLQKESDKDVKIAIINGLVQFRRGNTINILFAEQLHKEETEPEVRIALVQGLYHLMQDKAADILIEPLQKETDNKVKIAIIKQLGHIIIQLRHIKSDDIVDNIIKTLLVLFYREETEKDVKIAIIKELGSTGNNQIVKQFTDTFYKEGTEREVKIEILNAFGYIQTDEAEKLLITQLHEGTEKEIRAASANALSMSGRDKATEPLIKQLKKETDKSVKITIIRILGSTKGDKAGKAVDALIDSYSAEQEEEVKAYIISTFRTLLQNAGAEAISKKYGINIKLTRYLITHPKYFLMTVLDPKLKQKMNEVSYQLNRERTNHPKEPRLNEDDKLSLFDYLYALSSVDNAKSAVDSYFRSDPNKYQLNLDELKNLLKYISVETLIKVLRLIKDNPKQSLDEITADIKKSIASIDSVPQAEQIPLAEQPFLMERLHWILSNMFVLNEKIDPIKTIAKDLNDKERLIGLLSSVSSALSFDGLKKISEEYGIELAVLLQLKIDSSSQNLVETLVVQGISSVDSLQSPVKEQLLKKLTAQYEMMPYESRMRIYTELMFKQSTDNKVILSVFNDLMSGKPLSQFRKYPLLHNFLETNAPVLTENPGFKAFIKYASGITENNQLKELMSQARNIFTRKKYSVKKVIDDEASLLAALENSIRPKDTEAVSENIPHIFIEPVLKLTETDNGDYDQAALSRLRDMFSVFVRNPEFRDSSARRKDDLQKSMRQLSTLKTHPNLNKILPSILEYLELKYGKLSETAVSTASFEELDKLMGIFYKVVDVNIQANAGRLNSDLLKITNEILNDLTENKKIDLNKIDEFLTTYNYLFVDKLLARFDGKVDYNRILVRVGIVTAGIDGSDISQGVEPKLVIKNILTDYAKNNRRFNYKDHNGRNIYELVDLFLSTKTEPEFFNLMLETLIKETKGEFKDWLYSKNLERAVLEQIIINDISSWSDVNKARFEDLTGNSRYWKLMNAKEEELAEFEELKQLKEKISNLDMPNDYETTIEKIIELELANLPEKDRARFMSSKGDMLSEKLASAEGFNPLKAKIAAINSWQDNLEYTTTADGTDYFADFTDDFYIMFNIGNYPGSTACQSCTYGTNLNNGLLGYLVKGTNKAIALRNDKGYVVVRRIVRLKILQDAEGKEFPAIYVEENAQFGSFNLGKLYGLLNILSKRTGLPVVIGGYRSSGINELEGNPLIAKVTFYKGRTGKDYSDSLAGSIDQQEPVIIYDSTRAELTIKAVPAEDISVLNSAVELKYNLKEVEKPAETAEEEAPSEQSAISLETIKANIQHIPAQLQEEIASKIIEIQGKVNRKEIIDESAIAKPDEIGEATWKKMEGRPDAKEAFVFIYSKLKAFKQENTDSELALKINPVKDALQAVKSVMLMGGMVPAKIPEAEKAKTPVNLDSILVKLADFASKLINVYSLPKWLQDRVPVYRAVERRYAGLPDKQGVNYWFVGTANRAYSENFLAANSDYVLIETTIGELRKVGDVEIHYQGKKLYLRNFKETPFFRIVAVTESSAEKVEEEASEKPAAITEAEQPATTEAAENAKSSSLSKQIIKRISGKARILTMLLFIPILTVGALSQLKNSQGDSYLRIISNKFGRIGYNILSRVGEKEVHIPKPPKASVNEAKVKAVLKDYKERVYYQKNQIGVYHPSRAEWVNRINEDDVILWQSSWWAPLLEEVKKNLKHGDYIPEKVIQVLYTKVKELNPSATDEEIIQFLYNEFSEHIVGNENPGFRSEYIRLFEDDDNPDSGPDKFSHFVEGAHLSSTYPEFVIELVSYAAELKDSFQKESYADIRDVVAASKGSEWTKRLGDLSEGSETEQADDKQPASTTEPKAITSPEQPATTEPTLTQLTPEQLDTLVRDGITVTENTDGKKTLSVHIKIAFTDEQMKAIDKAVNDYINDYEGLVERIIEIVGIRLGLKEDDFKCEVGSCVGVAVLPEAAPETASDIDETISDITFGVLNELRIREILKVMVSKEPEQLTEKEIEFILYLDLEKIKGIVSSSVLKKAKNLKKKYGDKTIVEEQIELGPTISENEYTSIKTKIHNFVAADESAVDGSKFSDMNIAFIVMGSLVTGWAPLKNRPSDPILYGKQYISDMDLLVVVKDEYWDKLSGSIKLFKPVHRTLPFNIDTVYLADSGFGRLISRLSTLRIAGKQNRKISIVIMPESKAKMKFSNWRLIYNDNIDLSKLMKKSAQNQQSEQQIEAAGVQTSIIEYDPEAEFSAEPTLTQLTSEQLDTLSRYGITVTPNPDNTKTLQVDINIDFTDEQREAITQAVNKYINDYEGLVERIKEIIGVRLGLTQDDFKCEAGSCVGEAVLPEAAPETAKVERDITTIIIETAKKSAGPKYVRPNTVSKSNKLDKTIEPSGLYTFCLDNKYKCSGVAGIFGIAFVLLIMLVTYGIANYISKNGDAKIKGDNIQETEDEEIGIDYSGLPNPSDSTEETQEVPMSEEEEFDYYFNCFENTPEEFADEGESISGDVYTVSSYLSTMIFTDGYLQQRTKICSGRVDNYLKYLSNKGFGDFLDSSLKIYSRLDDNQKGYLIEGLFRLGNGDAALVLLSFPLSDKEDVLPYGVYDVKYHIFDYAQKIINKGELDKETTLEHYIPLFYDNPTGEGLKFILDNLSPDERKAFIRELVMSDDPSIRKQFVEYKSQYNTEYTLPKDLLEEMYTETTDPLLKASLLDKMGIKELPNKLMKELDVLYETSDSETRKKMIESMDSLANDMGIDQAKSDPYNLFIIDKFKESSDANDLVVLGDVLDDNQLLGLYKKEPNFKKYLIAKAKQSGNIDEPFKFWFREFINSCVSDVECIVMIKTEEVWCTKGCQ